MLSLIFWDKNIGIASLSKSQHRAGAPATPCTGNYINISLGVDQHLSNECGCTYKRQHSTSIGNMTDLTISHYSKPARKHSFRGRDVAHPSLFASVNAQKRINIRLIFQPSAAWVLKYWYSVEYTYRVITLRSQHCLQAVSSPGQL